MPGSGPPSEGGDHGCWVQCYTYSALPGTGFIIYAASVIYATGRVTSGLPFGKEYGIVIKCTGDQEFLVVWNSSSATC